MAAAALQTDEATQSQAAVQPVIAPPPDTSPSEDDSHEEEDEGLALLPRHTKVLVIGNNRTKAGLVGLTGVVKKAVGLGGWHWLVLATGEEVRLQRNALSVVEHPTGLESDFSDMEDNGPASQAQEALPKVRSRRPPRPLAHSPEISAHKRMSSRQHPRLNFNKLDSSALKRYRRHYKLADVGPNSSKEQLVDAVAHHFMAQTVDEHKVIATFIAYARRCAQVTEA